jgi:hypothetical protein
MLWCALSSAHLSSSDWHESQLRKSDIADVFQAQNLFARQSRIHLIKLPKTIALYTYATII